MTEQQKKPPRAEAYVLVIKIENKPYYVMDLQGSLSRNVTDSMLFFDEISAESYAGPIEWLIEKNTKMIATVRVVKFRLLSIIPKTLIECVSCP